MSWYRSINVSVPWLRLIPILVNLSAPLTLKMALHRGDDLEDDFMPDETVALSEDEGFGSLVGDPDDIGKLLSADEEDEGDVSPVERTKPLLEKKRKRREKDKERKAKECPPCARALWGS